MRYLITATGAIILFLLTSNFGYSLTASEYFSKYKYELESGEIIKVVVKVKGEPESQDPLKRAKEIRYLQGAILKFIHFAGANNVKSDTWNNEFSAEISTSLFEVLEKRDDLVSIKIISHLGNLNDEIKNTTENDRCVIQETPIDWSDCDLYGRVLTDVDLRNANLSRANLLGTDLEGRDLTGVDLSYAFLKLANLDGANLTNANLSNAYLINTDVRNADLSNTIMTNAKLYRSDFTSTNLTNADLRNSILSYANLSFVNLKGANLEGSGTWNTNLNHCYNHPLCDDD